MRNFTCVVAMVLFAWWKAHHAGRPLAPGLACILVDNWVLFLLIYFPSVGRREKAASSLAVHA